MTIEADFRLAIGDTFPHHSEAVGAATASTLSKGPLPTINSPAVPRLSTCICSDLLLPFSPAGPGAAAGAAAAAPAAAEKPKEEKKPEVKTHVDIKLKAFDAKNKIKVIKEIRGVTNLGLKEVSQDRTAALPRYPCLLTSS